VIARVWHGAVPADWADAYHEYLRKTGVRDAVAAPGNRGIRVLKRVDEDVAHFLFVSFWDSMDAIRSFAGEKVERARYYPEDEIFLLELEPEVTHYEVLEAEG
jgi:heme-degrading monooxygenase HmoA